MGQSSSQVAVSSASSGSWIVAPSDCYRGVSVGTNVYSNNGHGVGMGVTGTPSYGSVGVGYTFTK